MNPPYETYTREALVAENIELRRSQAELSLKLQQFQFELEQLKRLVFGSKRERFIPEQPLPGQLQLFQALSAMGEGEALAKQKVQAHERQVAKQQPKRRKEFPPHLPRHIVTIPPEEPVEGLVRIGEEVTETLDYQAAKVTVIRRIRPKYVDPANEDRGVIVAPAPERPFARSIAEVGLVAQVIIDKFVDHLPLYRQAKRFKRHGVHLPDSVLGDLVQQAFVLLFPLLERLRRRVLGEGYLQVDETTIQVQKVKPGKTHRGYFWGYYAVLARLAFFEYQQRRERAGPAQTLKTFKGYLQSDAYRVYDAFDLKEGVDTLNCWGHARRKFFEAKSVDPQRAAEALGRIQQLYLIEDKLRALANEPNYYELRLGQRQALAVPILEELHAWLTENQQYTLPQSPIGKAFFYVLSRWKRFLVYATDGRLEIDNVWLEPACHARRAEQAGI
ncbi:MAG: IS66 family transposase [Lewinellaceae bacterium]|nr:IS66 family transposase [Lewinellaceae bacterium]